MNVVYDKDWVDKVKLLINATIATSIGNFDAYISKGGWATAIKDDVSTYNFHHNEFAIIKMKENSK